MQPRGKYTMVKIPSKWLPIWQGLMDIAAGTLVVPDEYHAVLPRCAPSEARDTMNAWLQTLFIRQRDYPGCPGSFNPGTVATMLGQPLGYASRGWEWLVLYGYVDPTGPGGEYFLPGQSPIADPEAFDRGLFGSGQEVASAG
jgi:hypothetical protein